MSEELIQSMGEVRTGDEHDEVHDAQWCACEDCGCGEVLELDQVFVSYPEEEAALIESVVEAASFAWYANPELQKRTKALKAYRAAK